MEFVPLSDTALRYLASDDPVLKRFFYGVYPSDMLPDQPLRTTRAAYIVNTDNIGWPCGRKMERVKSLHCITYIKYTDFLSTRTTYRRSRPGWNNGMSYDGTPIRFKP